MKGDKRMDTNRTLLAPELDQAQAALRDAAQALMDAATKMALNKADDTAQIAAFEAYDAAQQTFRKEALKTVVRGDVVAMISGLRP